MGNKFAFLCFGSNKEDQCFRAENPAQKDSFGAIKESLFHHMETTISTSDSKCLSIEWFSIIILEFLLAVGGEKHNKDHGNCHKKAEYFDNEKWIEVDEVPIVRNINSYFLRRKT